MNENVSNTPVTPAACGCGEEFGSYCSNVGRDHFAICAVHNTYWWSGSNLFSNWTMQSREDWAAAAKKLKQLKPLGDGDLYQLNAAINCHVQNRQPVTAPAADGRNPHWHYDTADRYIRESFEMLEPKVKMVVREGKTVPDVASVLEPVTNDEIAHLVLTLYWAKHHIEMANRLPSDKCGLCGDEISGGVDLGEDRYMLCGHCWRDAAEAFTDAKNAPKEPMAVTDDCPF